MHKNTLSRAEDGRFILKLDASSLAHSGCLRRLYNQVVLGLKDPVPSIDMEYGSAFHKFVEHLAITGDQAGALSVALEYFKSKTYEPKKAKLWMTPEHLTLTCIAYVQQYGARGERLDFKRIVDDKGTPLVEANFAIPFYQDSRAIVLLCGTMDEIGKFSGGCFAIGDYKTTSIHDQASFLAKFALSQQLIIYVYVIKWLAEHYPDSPYSKMLGSRVGAFIEGVFLAASKVAEFRRSEVFFYSDELIKEVMNSVEAVAQELISYISEGEQPPRLGVVSNQCETRYGGMCPFFYACCAPDDIASNHVINNNFKQEPYNPLEFRK